MRQNKMLSFDQRYRKAMQLKTAQRQRVAREVKERHEELLEDLQFNQVHARLRSLNGGTKSNDPVTQGLKRLDRLATQLGKEEPYATENAYAEGERNRREALLEMQEMTERVQARIANEVRAAREIAATQRPLY